jgi:hypothetical protein
MGLETVTSPVTPDQLNQSWPLPTDPKEQGDDHIRNTKAALVEFFRKVNFAGLPNGAIPVYLGGQFTDTGLSLIGGGALFQRPFTAPQYLKDGGLNPSPQYLVGIPLTSAASKRPVAPVPAAEATLLIQPSKAQVNTGAIAFSFVQDSDAFVRGITVESASVAVNRVRLTLRQTNAAGAIVYQTATDAELKAGGGASISATGESFIAFPIKLEMFSGQTIHVTVDRFDTATNSFVTSGISLKGDLVSGVFVPYHYSTRQAITRKGVAVSTDIPTKSTQVDTAVQTVSALTVVGTFTVQVPSELAGQFLIETLTVFSGVDNANYTINIFVNNVLVDHGDGVTCRIESAATSRTFHQEVIAVSTLAAGTHTIRVELTPSTGSVSKRICRFRLGKTDAGDLWI